MLTIEPDLPRARRPLEHAGQEGADGAVHRLHVEVEGKIPVLLRAFQHRAVMHEAGAVEEHVDLADRRGELFHRRGVAARSSASSRATPASSSPSSFATSTSVAITSAPSRANASAVARPIPCPAAVRNARLPSSRPIAFPLCISCRSRPGTPARSPLRPSRGAMPCASLEPRLDRARCSPRRRRRASSRACSVAISWRPSSVQTCM